MIEVENLSKHYGNLKAVDDISFRVERGEIVGFLGLNGAGKTTTMRVLTGFLPPTDGHVRVGDFDVFEDWMEARRRIGYLPETPPLYPDLSVRRYLRFVAELKDVHPRQISSRVDEVVERVALHDVERRLIRNLSKGYRQRVGLAQALIHDPPVLVLDEPTSGLDPGQIIETRKLIKSLAGQHTIILSTHILPEVAATCERVIIIHKGRIASEDTLDELGQNRFRVRMVVKGPADDVGQAIKHVDGVVGVRVTEANGEATTLTVESSGADVREDLFKSVVDGHWVLLEMRPEAASLEEVFMSLTTADEAA